MLPTPFSPKAFPKASQPSCAGVFSVSIGLLSKSNGIEPHHFAKSRKPHPPLKLQVGYRARRRGYTIPRCSFHATRNRRVESKTSRSCRKLIVHLKPELDIEAEMADRVYIYKIRRTRTWHLICPTTCNLEDSIIESLLKLHNRHSRYIVCYPICSIVLRGFGIR
jgi:hypothetical protein